MKHTPKHQVVQAIKVINETYGQEVAQLIDWSDCGDGYAIWTEFGVDALDISANATVHGALPKGTFLEPIDQGSMRLVRA